MEEARDIFAEARIFLKKRRLERMGIYVELKAYKVDPQEPEKPAEQLPKDSA